MGKEKRFECKYSQWSYSVIVDRLTGVNYLQVNNGTGLSLTPLLQPDGKPVTDTPTYFEEFIKND